MPLFLSAGRVYCDLNFSGIEQMPQPGREVFADALSLHAGGGVFITAAYAAALGCPARMLSHLPDQPFTAIIENEARRLGIDLRHTVLAGGQSPQLTVAMVTQGDRAFLTRRSGKALPANLAQVLGSLAEVDSARHLHISELSTLLEHPELLPLARQSGFSISLDCAWDEHTLTHPQVASLIAGVDVFLPNASEMGHLERNGIDVHCAPLTVIKQGAAGATAHEGDRQLHVAAENCKVVDTIGAGDAFNAGFLMGWFQRWPLQRCLAIGNACGAIAVARRGGTEDLPDLRYLLELEDGAD